MTSFPVQSLGPYLLLEPLGDGGMAEVWLALRRYRPGAHRFCALKCILPPYEAHPDYIGLFRHEAAVSLRMAHPNVVATWEYCVVGGRHTMVQEWMPGVTLAELLDVHGALPQDTAVYVATEVLAALAYVHALCDESGTPMQVVHRDVCPGNVHIGYDGRCRRFDFGVCRTYGEDLAIQRGSIVGTAAYISPEQCRSAVVDGRSDLFSLAAVLADMLSGESLFARDNPIRTYRAITAGPIALSPLIDADLGAVILRDLDRDYRNRHANADEFARALQPWLRGGARERLHDIVLAHFGERLRRDREICAKALETPAIPQGSRDIPDSGTC